MARSKRTTSSRYLIAFAAMFVAVTALVLALNVVGYRTGLVNPSQKQLLQLRSAEMAAEGKADIVFVGDSGLARSIDEELVAARTGQVVRSYPLTAAFGYAGTYNMMRRVIASDHPTTIVIMQSPRTAGEAPSNVGYLMSAQGLANDLPTPDLIKSYLSVPNAFATMRNAVFARKAAGPSAGDLAVYKSRRKDTTKIVADAQALESLSARDKLSKQFLFRDSYTLKISEDPHQWRWLDRMAAVCKAGNVRCVWLNGPLYDPYCRTSQKAFAQLGEKIASRGLQVINPQPYCVPISEIDDLPEHPARRMTPVLTQWYLDRLQAAGIVRTATPPSPPRS